MALSVQRRRADMDISETTIAADALRRGGVNAGDAYHVRLEITRSERERGNFTNRYKIKEVLEFRPGHGHTQEVMQFEDPGDPKDAES